MYGLNELKPKIKVDGDSVECPVINCLSIVERQRQVFKLESRFQCPIHKIYLSPSTFEYESKEDNLLWTDFADLSLLDRISKVKRESRMARENSEDALTWNVFRFLDKQNLLPEFLSRLSNKPIKKTELILWSYSPEENSGWSSLNEARDEFGEPKNRGSEPDIIIVTDKVLYFIEAKLTATNKTKPSNPMQRKKYESGGNGIFHKIFKTDFETVAIKDERYELMRFWILGNWIAAQMGIDFEFYGLVLQSNEPDLEAEFDKHIMKTSKNEFSRLTWEQIFKFIMQTGETPDKQKMIRYFQNKTIGYNSSNLLIKAFDI
ncbi:MAG: hypothetical protein WCS03_02770 [Bacteroidota bacterium]